MATRFNADEILEMAGRIETNGARFYREAARLLVAARDLLNEIARQEDLHYQTFMEMRRRLAPSEKPNAVDLTGEAEMYLAAMVEGLEMDINRDPAEVLTAKASLKDIFRVAIGLEKDSIAFYLGLKEMVPPAFGREKIDAIVAQEMQHIAWLHDKRKALGA